MHDLTQTSNSVVFPILDQYLMLISFGSWLGTDDQIIGLDFGGSWHLNAFEPAFLGQILSSFNMKIYLCKRLSKDILVKASSF